MTPLAWTLLAAAVLVAPTARAGPIRRDRAGRPRLLVPAAVAGIGAACVALGGPVVGVVAAAVLCPLGWRALRRVAARPRDGAPVVDASVPLVLDLTAAALHAGRPPADALSAAAPAAPPGVASAFERVAGLLRLGAEPVRAWELLARDGPMAPVATVAARSAWSGARQAGAFERLAVELRAETATRAATRAQRAGVLAMAPLGLCFLPAFVLIGVVPVVVGMARSVLEVVP